MKRLLLMVCVVVMMGVLAGTVFAALKQCTPWTNWECVKVKMNPGSTAPQFCVWTRIRTCWDPDSPADDWNEREIAGVCNCPAEPTPLPPTPVPTPSPTPIPTPKPMAARATIYVTAGPNEWVELTSEDGLDVWWVGQTNGEGGLILSIPLVPGLLHRFYNPAHYVTIIRDLTTNQLPVDLHPDHGCKNCVRK